MPLLLLALFSSVKAAEPEAARSLLARAALAPDDTVRRQLLLELVGRGEPEIATIIDSWRTDKLHLWSDASGTRRVVEFTGEPDASGARRMVDISTGAEVVDAAGQAVLLLPKSLRTVDHTSGLRRVMRTVLELVELGAEDVERRFRAVQTLGQSQDATKLPALEKRLTVETNARVIRGLNEAIALIGLKSSDRAVRMKAAVDLREIASLASTDFLMRAQKEATEAKDEELMLALDKAQKAVESHRSTVDMVGTLFRGISLGSILLVTALGLAITFGLMRVINMAHGEMIAIGAYTTYLTQHFFGSGVTIPCFGLSMPIPGMKLEGAAYNSYFLFALPLSFLTAALAGMLLERTVIRFLYKRPLESLLATWGVSLVIQQVLKLTFGANNVQVGSPVYLSGNWTVNDIVFGWNRVFVIAFAGLIVLGMHLVLTRTSLGLFIRASMQNSSMASCMGVRTSRVNLLTFGLGSGLAGLAGAFLSQIGNVGPSLGQSYIIDSFMVVVVGGVGSLAGTIISAFGIGGADQVMQQYLPTWAPGLGGVPVFGSFLQNLAQDAAVFGKILVLVGIILFLQWRPAGLFVTRSRNLED